jgi:putative endopeptidase
MRFVSLSLAATLALAPTVGLAAGGGQPKSDAASGFDVSNLDRSVQACEDFNKFANGGWMSKNPVPAEYPSWGTFAALRDRNIDAVHTILEAASKSKARKGSEEQKIGDYYYSALDTKTRDAEGIKPLAPWLKRIDEVKDAASLQDAWAALAAYNVDAPFGIGSAPDFKNSKMAIGIVGQGGLGLPDRDYYLKDDEKSKMIREEYLKHVGNIFRLAGDDEAKAAADARTVMDIETRLAKASLTNVELRDPSNSYHIMTADERKALTPNFDWDRYFAKTDVKISGTMNVAHPKFFAELNAMMTEVPLDAWKTYLRWHLMHATASTLSTPFGDENFNFYGRVLSGTKEQSPLWKRAVNATSSSLGEAVGSVYVKQYFPPESKRRMQELVSNLKAALRDDIQQLDWMSEATRKQAVAKLDAFKDKIGYPDKWKDYSRLEITRGAYAVNALNARHWAFVRDAEKIDKPVDRGEWGMTPQTVNAQYNPFNNDITFPAGILQPPFFNPTADDAVNYGAIGAVIGHEMTHGFDDQGARFDAEGNLKMWWTPEDFAKFTERAKCVEDEYSSFAIDDGTHVKGALVKGESIADLGGLKIAWLAYQKSLEGKPRPADVDGFTPEQRFFLGFAQVWASNSTPQFELLQTNTNEHPLGRFRLNGTVANMPEFFKAFGCGDNTKMVRSGPARCQIW